MRPASPTLFIDRDGTLIVEPPDKQVDAFEKLRFMPGVVPALLALQSAGYRLVMITNQDGLGSESFPQAQFDGPHDLLMQLLESQGVGFDAVLICPHLPADGCSCRKPGTALVDRYLAQSPMQPATSWVLGDRDSDLQLAANLGIGAIRIRADGSDDETWAAALARLLPSRQRRAQVSRRTRETDIEVQVNLDDTEPVDIATGIGFFDHMLEQIARHGGFSLQLRCRGDLQVDEHHTVEDCALALGQALRQALGDKLGIARYGFLLPMDESQAQVAIDLSGRPYAVFKGSFSRDQVGGLPTELVPHFFRSLADALGAAVQVSVQGENSHHMVEACFKAVGRALRQAIRVEDDVLPSSKGVL